jgi:hypothetical protein
MPFERWGSLSVADHTDTESLTANVLLYDRLIVPVMTDQVDRDERHYWVDHGWDPDLQLKRLDEMEELAIRRPWDRNRRKMFKSRAAQLAAEQVDAYAVTRQILAQEQVIETIPGVQHVQVIAAYNSTSGLKHDYRLADVGDHLSAQAYLLTRRLAVPDAKDPEKAFKLALELSRDPGFRSKRAALFDWQETLPKGCTPQAAVERLAEMADTYNDEVRAASGKVRWKLAFTVCGIGLGFATGGVAAAAAAAALSLVQFAMFDGKPVVEAGDARPAAMFHDIKVRVGIPLAQK